MNKLPKKLEPNGYETSNEGRIIQKINEIIGHLQAKEEASKGECACQKNGNSIFSDSEGKCPRCGNRILDIPFPPEHEESWDREKYDQELLDLADQILLEVEFDTGHPVVVNQKQRRMLGSSVEYLILKKVEEGYVSKEKIKSSGVSIIRGFYLKGRNDEINKRVPDLEKLTEEIEYQLKNVGLGD